MAGALPLGNATILVPPDGIVPVDSFLGLFSDVGFVYLDT